MPEAACSKQEHDKYTYIAYYSFKINSDALAVVKHSVAKVIFLSNSLLVSIGAKAVSNDLFERLPVLLLLLPALLPPLSPSLYIFYIRFKYTDCYNALQEKALKKYNAL